MTALDSALRHLEDRRPQTLETLKRLVRIPGVSARGFPPEPLVESAEAVAGEMKRIGLENVAVIRMEGVHPYVYGDWLHAEGAPTVLLYGHHDVQPPGRPALWKSPPFEPVEREGRLYGRGAVDDKAGVVAHLAAIEAFLGGPGAAPVNLKFIVEGEEETGSENLARFLDTYREQLAADVIVLTDTANYDTGIPSLTYRLRGMVIVDVEVRGLDHPLHSGMWGGPVPDPALGLARLLGGLMDDDGRVTIPGFYDDVREPSPGERERLHGLPYTESRFREQSGMLEGVPLIGESDYSVWERIWIRPSLTVSVLEAGTMKEPVSQILDVARARIGARLVPDQDPRAVGERIAGHLRAHAPWGMQVTATVESSAGWWVTEPEGPAFDAAFRAMEAGFGTRPTAIGCGGSIPFVEPFARVLGGVPALLTGVEDPICNAHAENESLSLEDFHKTCRTSVHLYQELSGLAR